MHTILRDTFLLCILMLFLGVGSKGQTPVANTSVWLGATVNPDSLALGSQVTMQVSIQKDSTLSATGVQVSTMLSGGLTLVGHVAPAGTSFDVNTGIWSVNNTLNNPLVTSLTLSLLVRADSPGVLTMTSSITQTDQTNITANSTMASTCLSVPIEICAGESIELKAPGGLTSYQWFKDDTEIVGATDSLYITGAPGRYRFTTTSPQGCESGSECPVYLFVKPLPVPTVNGLLAICPGGSTTLTASGGTSFMWSTGDTTASITVSPSDSTLYTVMVSNAAGCADTVSMMVKVHAPITYTVATDCDSNNTPSDNGDDTFTFTLNPAGGSKATYSLSGAISAAGLSYGAPFQSTAFLISSGAKTIVLTDNTTGCQETIQILPPMHCSSCPPQICVPVSVTIKRR
ncbi:MAG: DUF11 domain-containing protein [Bacteroidetes bacterium]|nr:DUF11 domain-containing protein [Bacteroidota bacterium]